MPLLEPLPAVFGSEIVFRAMPPPALERLRLRLALPNPKFVALKRFNRFVGAEPETIESLIEMPDGSVHVPRGCVALLKEQLAKVGLALRLGANTSTLGAPLAVRPTDRAFVLRDYQEEGIAKLLAKLQGLIVLPCVAGDTEIGLNRAGKGFQTTIADAFSKTHGGAHAWDPSIPTFIRGKSGDQIRLLRVDHFLDKGYRTTIEVRFSSGRSLRLTPEHEILTAHGFVAARDLRPGDEVIGDDFAHVPCPRRPKPVYRRLSWYPSHPFARIVSASEDDGTRTPKGRTKRRKRGWVLEEHRAVAEASINGLTLDQFRARCRTGDTEGLTFIDPKRFHVHHVDENHRNNRPDNLEVLPATEHLRSHSPGYSNFPGSKPSADRVTEIREGRLERVYDVACSGPSHNFCANGVVVHNCGTGKTKLGVGAVLRCGRTALVLVHTIDLADQWFEELHAQGIDVGRVGDGQDDRHRSAVVGLIDSVLPILEREPAWGERFGTVILDEAHHAPAATVQRTLRLLPARYRLGLTATPEREDGLTKLVGWSFGDVLLERETREMIALGYLMPAAIEILSTGFFWSYDGPEKKRLATLEKDVAGDLLRNALVADRVAAEAVAGETCLVLCRTRAHVGELAEMIEARGVAARGVTGKTAKKKRRGDIGALRAGTIPVLVATSLADEGLDLPRLSVIALAAPQRARGATIQRLGRLLRLWKGKKPKLLDFVDDDVPVLASRATDRRKVYRDAGLLRATG